MTAANNCRAPDATQQDRRVEADAAPAREWRPQQSGQVARQTPPPAQPRRAVSRAMRRGYSTLLRQIFRATHDAELRDAERLWPHAKIERDEMGRITDFRIGRRAIPIANAAVAQRPGPLDGSTGALPDRARTAHLIATGPSIADIDYTSLNLSNVLGVNGTIALGVRHGVPFDFYCVTDKGFIRHRRELVANIIARDLLFFTTPICLWTILQTFPARSIACRFFLIERVGKQALCPTRSVEEVASTSGGALLPFGGDHELGFSQDVRQGVFPGGTVAFEALQVLTWLGFESIVLHGIDLANAASTPRFYETADDTLPTMLHRQLAHEIEPSFRQTAPLLQQRGIHVTNLSPVSALGEDIFPKRDWREALQPFSV